MKRIGPVSNHPNELVVRMGRGLLIMSLIGGAGCCAAGLMSVIDLGLSENNIGYVIIGCLLFVFGIALCVSTFLIYYRSYQLITVEGIWEHDSRNRTRYLRWESVKFVGVVDSAPPLLVCSKHIPQENSYGFVSYRYPWPKEQTIQIMWSYSNEEQEARFREILAASNAPLAVKKTYLGEDYIDELK